MRLLFIWLAYITGRNNVLAQLVKGSFGLATSDIFSDPICIQCSYAAVEWYGGQAPYTLSVSGYHNDYKLANVGITQGTRMKWHVNFPTGTRLWFQLLDANQTDIYTNIVTVAASGDASCVNMTNPLVVDSSSTVSRVSATSSFDGSSATAASSDSPGQRSLAGPIAGGVTGGIIALLLLLSLVFWLGRRNGRPTVSSGPQGTLDLSENRSDDPAVEPFTISVFTPTANVAHSSPKMSSIATRSVSTAYQNSPSSRPSIIATSSPTPGSSAQIPSSEPPSVVPTQTQCISRKQLGTSNQLTASAPVQEQDAGVSLAHNLPSEEPTTLPPAYDSSWRRS